MPRKPLQPCAYPGCVNTSNERYCVEHRKTVARNYNKYTRDQDVIKKYNSSWRRIRKHYAGQHPFCEECLARGILHVVDEVHHIVPLSESGTHEVENLKSLCHSCHMRAHRTPSDGR